MQTRCLFCGNPINLVFVHGHYQCPLCKTNALPCCDGDNCNNAFLSANNAADNPVSSSEDQPENYAPLFTKQQNK